MQRFWQQYSAYIMALIFTVGISWMTFRQYTTFQLNAPDVATFGQAMWNTLHGRFLYSTIIERSVLGYHFTPFFALLSPLLLIWADIRVLFVAQTVGFAVTGLLLYQIVRDERPELAPWFLLAFYLNPALHELALIELRRVTFAAPFVALALVGLHGRRYKWMSVGLLFALLCKEDVALIVIMIGVFLLVRRREWAWGAGIFVLGVGSLLLTTFCLIPSFGPDATGFSCTGNYPQLNYFGNLDASEAERSGSELVEGGFETVTGMLGTIVSQPLELLTHMFDADGRAALWRVFLPLGLILPFLAWDWLLMAVPIIGVLLLSERPTLHTLSDWYLAYVLPVLFAAVAVALLKLPERYQKWGVVLLLATTVVGYRQYSGLPLGAEYIPVRYEIIEHHRQAAEVISMIPAEAAVAAQDAFVAHLTQRENLYLYPWYDEENAPLDYVLLDRHSRQYPFDQAGISFEIDNQVADPAQVIAAEVDGIYLFAQDGVQHPAVVVDAVAEESIRLERVEVATADEQGFYVSDALANPVDIKQGQQVRVTLYWEAMAKPPGERTVSVRLVDVNGALVGQHDMQPSQGARPTTWWEPGWYFRDVYYFEVNPAAAVGLGSLQVQLYDSYTQEIVPLGGADALEVVPVEIRPLELG